MFSAIWRKIKGFFRNLSIDLGEAIDDGDWRYILYHLLRGFLAISGGCAVIALLVILIAVSWELIVGFVLVPAFVIYVIVCAIKMEKPSQEVSEAPNTVDEELTRQRAKEQYDDMLALIFNAVQATANITPLLRPHDLFDIQTNSAREEHFYLEKSVVIFQFECDLESPIDKASEDAIQREMQRAVIKHSARYSLLITSEAQGRAPVEVLDIKNLGNRVLIECCLTTSASIPLIEARRRARIERQQRQQAVLDRDYN